MRYQAVWVFCHAKFKQRIILLHHALDVSFMQFEKMAFYSEFWQVESWTKFGKFYQQFHNNFLTFLHVNIALDLHVSLLSLSQNLC